MWVFLLSSCFLVPNPDSFEGDEPGECVDGADNDADGFFDCDDEDCASAPDCEAAGLLDVSTGGTTTQSSSNTPAAWTGGFDVGTQLPNFVFEDAFGTSVTISGISAEYLAIEACAMWNAPCQELAAELPQILDVHEPQGLTWLTVLVENLVAEDPTPEDLMLWSDSFQNGVSVVADPEMHLDGLGPIFPHVIVVDSERYVVLNTTETQWDILCAQLRQVTGAPGNGCTTTSGM